MRGVMTRQVRKASGLALATALIAAVTASIARADDRVVAKVPFAFVVGDTRLPAGDYIIRTASDDPSVWAISSADGQRSVMVMTIKGSSFPAPTTPELVFDRFENQYFLARVVGSNDDEREVPLTPSRMEHEVIKLELEP
jgi:hypothetical protein